MDETGHSGDTGSADSGAGADSRDRTLVNGWSTADSPWSTPGSARPGDDEIPAWRRPAQEIRPFARQSFETDGHPGFGPPPSPFADRPADAAPARTGPGDTDSSDNGGSRAGDPADGPPPEPAAPADEPPPPRWSDSRTRYTDLLHHFSPRGVEPTGAPAAPARFAALERRPGSLEDTLDVPPPSSAPPYPYEGDLDDADRPAPPPVVRLGAAVPL